MIRVGIVGSNYGRTVQLPAFRADPRCEVIALAGSNAARTAEIAKAESIAKGYGDWRALVEDNDVQAVAIATLPSLQAQIAIRALELGKPVFAEKPMASDLASASAMLKQASVEPQADNDRLQFPSDHGLAARQIDARCQCHRRAAPCHRALARGKPRHPDAHAQLEDRGRRWRRRARQFHLTLLPLSRMVLRTYCRAFGARFADCRMTSELETTVAMALQFAAGPLVSLSMSCASYLGIGHRIEFFGEDGTLVLHNPGADYMRGFDLLHAKRPATAFERIPVAGSGRCEISGWPHCAGVAAGQDVLRRH